MKQKTGRKLLSFLLTLALVLGLLPSMSLTAYAAPTETLLTTITGTGSNAPTATSANVSYSTEGVATLTFSGSVSYQASPAWGWWGYGWTATVNAAEGYTITKCVFYDDANRTATDSSSPFVVETTEKDKTPRINDTPIDGGKSQSKGLKKIEVYGYATPAATHSVNITAGDHMTKTAGSGDAEQTGLTGAMTDVVYTADNGYYYPTDYSVAEVSGIKVTRNSYTQITVSGTPTADAAITLTAPTAKTTPDAPTTAAATDCTTADNNDGKLTGVTTAMEYKKSDAADWTAGTGSDITGLVPGTYYVRIKATDTTLASDNQELTVNAAQTQMETLLTTVTPTGKSTYSETTAGVVTVTFDPYTYNSTYGWLWFESGSVSVAANEGYTITKCVFRQNAKDPITVSAAPFAIHFEYGMVKENRYSDMDGITSIEVYGYASKAAQTITAEDVTVTYGDTDKSVSATVTEPTTGGGEISYAVKTGSEDYIDVASDGKLTIKKVPSDGKAYVTVTAAATDDYAQATKEVTVTINTKAMTFSAEDVNVTVDGQPHGITVNVTDPASGATVKYGTEEGSYTLDASPTQTEVGTLTVYYQVTADNYTTYTGSATVTVSDKSTQTITASDVTATYGDTGKKVEATTDGNGAISYAVKDGSGDYIEVNASTGALTIKKVGTATVIVTAAETATYAQATKEVTVTINKANAVAATVTANSRTYDGTDKPLVNVDNSTLVGGTMQYALGTATEATQPYTTSIPTGTNAGTYYVWYKVVGDENHSDTIPASVTVTIQRRSSGGGSSTTTVTVPVTSDAAPGTVPVKASVSGTTATVTKLTDEQLAQVTTNKSGNKDADAETETNSVVIDVSGVAKDVKTATIPTETVKAVEETGSNLKVTLTDGSVEFDATAQAIITDEAKGTTIQVNLDAVKVTTLTSAQQSAVESLEVEVVLDAYVTSNGQRISDFKGGSATLSVPYTLKDGQAAQGIVVWYVASDGTRTQVDASYDGKNVVFTVPHFSNYVIAYDAAKAAACPQDTTCPISAFTDARTTAWYHDGVHWAIENSVMNGVGDGKFAPNGITTRAQVVTMLWRLEGSPAYVGMSEFSDVDNEQWYGPAIRWASAEGIVNGYDDGRFGANDAVTREQLVTILYRYAQYKKMDVSVGEDTNILSYDDAFDVSEWAIPAMQWACGSGIVNGIDKNGTLMLAPSDASTRAVVATMFWRFSK